MMIDPFESGLAHFKLDDRSRCLEMHSAAKLVWLFKYVCVLLLHNNIWTLQ